jgi:hypothetical protein
LHLMIGWIYLVISPLFLPRHPAATVVKANPFAGTKEAKPQAPDKQ